MREICLECGGWIDHGADAASWDARLAEFDALHKHPAGAPVVFARPDMTDAARDAFAAVLDARGMVNHGYAPADRKRWAVFYASPAATYKTAGRLFVNTPDELGQVI